MWNLPYIWRASISQLNERKTDWEGILGEAYQNMAKQKDLVSIPVVQLFKLYVMSYKKSIPVHVLKNTPPIIVYV